MNKADIRIEMDSLKMNKATFMKLRVYCYTLILKKRVNMRKSVFLLAISIGLLIGFSGCAGIGPQPLETKSTQGTALKVIAFNFPKVDAVTGEKVDFSPESYDFTPQILPLTGYAAYQNRGGNVIQKYYGVKIQRSGGSYVLKYINGELNTNSWYLSEVNFPLSANKQSENEIVFGFPATYTYKPCGDAIGVSIKPLDNFTALEADAKNVFNQLDKLSVVISKNYDFKGEINTKYPDAAVYANFKRLLGQYSNWTRDESEKLSDVKKNNTFILNFKGKVFPLYVEVFPYRDGSKVVFSSTISYTIDSKGISSANKDDIQNLQKSIEKIAND